MIGSLLAHGVAPPDTLVTMVARDTLDYVFAFAAGSVAIILVALLLTQMMTLLHLRRIALGLLEAQRRLSADPAVESVRKTVANVEAISDTVRKEVVHLSASVSLLGDRLAQASDRLEERIEQFNALMEVVQGEAEGAFVKGAATARGVRAGLEALGNLRKRRDRGGTERGGPEPRSTRRGSEARGRSGFHPMDAHPDDMLQDDPDDTTAEEAPPDGNSRS